MSKIRAFISSDSVRGIAKLLSANVVAQVIGLLVYPLLTRMYSPEDFGLLNLFVSISSVLAILSTAEYQYAIVLPRDDDDARRVVHVCVLLLLVTTGLLLLTLPFSDQIASVFRTPALASYYVWMPLAVLGLGSWNILNYWFIRHKMFARISGYQMSQSALAATSKLALGYAGVLQGGLIYSMVIAPLVSIVLSVTLAFRTCIRRLFVIDVHGMKQVAHTYRNFPLFTMPRSFINVLAGQLPVLLLVPMFGTEHVGFWGMAMLLGFVPINMITKAIYQVMYQHITERVHAARPVLTVVRKFVIVCSIVAVPLFIGLAFILPEMTAWLLGEEWYVSGEYVRWMLPWLFFSLLTGSLCFLSDVFFQQKVGLYFEILLAFARVLGIALGLVMHSFVWAIAAYSIGTAIAVAAQLVWLMSLARKHDNNLSATINHL